MSCAEALQADQRIHTGRNTKLSRTHVKRVRISKAYVPPEDTFPRTAHMSRLRVVTCTPSTSACNHDPRQDFLHVSRLLPQIPSFVRGVPLARSWKLTRNGRKRKRRRGQSGKRRTKDDKRRRKRTEEDRRGQKRTKEYKRGQKMRKGKKAKKRKCALSAGVPTSFQRIATTLHSARLTAERELPPQVLLRLSTLIHLIRLIDPIPNTNSKCCLVVSSSSRNIVALQPREEEERSTNVTSVPPR